MKSKRKLVITLGALAFGAALVAGCSDDHGDHGSTGSPATGCAADSRKDIYTAGMTKPAGGMSVKILQATPSPPAKGTNAMTLEVMDAAGAPVDSATITVTPFMPDHGHGSAVTPTVTPMGAGKYEIGKVYLSMAGLWRITVTVQAQGASPQEATFQFCLDG